MTTKATKEKPRPADEPGPADVPELIAEFRRENKDLIEAMELFEVSSVEYERALRALTVTPSVTATSTQVQETEQDAALVE